MTGLHLPFLLHAGPVISIQEIWSTEYFIPAGLHQATTSATASMGANDMPYLYTPTTNRSSQIAYPYSDFNPKAVTQASYARLAHHNGPQHKKKEGPLINFNQHPDSYVVFTGSQQDHKPLHKGAKKAIVTTRWVQFALRILQEIVALGLLTCTICITSVDGAQKYLLRIPVSVPITLCSQTQARGTNSTSSKHGIA